MRLIEELLKDDFFHGGYQPGAATAVAEAQAPVAEGRKKTLFIAAGVAVALLALGGAAGYFFLGRSGTSATGTPAAMAKPVAGNLPAQARPEPVSEALAAPVSNPAEVPVVAEAPVNAEAPDAFTPASVAPQAAEGTQAAPPAPETVAEPAAEDQAAKPAPVAAPKYTLVFPKTTDKSSVEKLIAQLKQFGIKASIQESTEKGSVYKVVGVQPVPVAEANAVKLKASLFKVPANSTGNGDGTVSFDFGTYATPEEAKKAAADVQKLGIDIKLGRLTRDLPAYIVTSAQISKADAEKAAGDLTAVGFDASVKKVP